MAIKKLILLAILAALVVGCGTAKKVTGSKQETGAYTETTTETGKSNSTLFVDTTKVSGTEITYIKIEFYPPEPIKEPEATQPATEPTEDGPPKHPPNTGAVKSIETLTVKNDTEERGITEAESSTEVNRASEITSEATLAEATSEEPTADPYRWRYIFGILVLVIIIGTVGYFWLRKAGVFTKVASFFKKLF